MGQNFRYDFGNITLPFCGMNVAEGQSEKKIYENL